MSGMTKKEIEYLKLLGYQKTDEDGAILQHKSFHNMGRYVWEDESFQDVLSMYHERLNYSIKAKMLAALNNI